ncbi:Clp protease N-terminal domain-containing protein [Streptacidiphilus sp. P02-A3a]|uniref:Clp protease N-terminal domain-containing protein n=1 Tax=Streptacidiphilus sp. P02-A3a TaxID=2704468 RepID=UPI0015FCE7C9|nr:Clp protease N-terminal domain-containing protein [Streptacidiphilus sp. P02-A3a]QMU70519.1 ATP-dependent Clp protease ATP-binding subunit [Streptacidiphilus sp. P02-A3a]
MSPLDISLADLIARLDEELPDANDLTCITEARLRAQTLSDLGDQLVDHYVSKARQEGASWSEIGDAIGVSKQAAQQRHSPAAFERFTDLNRHSIVLAQEAARTHRHDFIGTEHLLLGLLGEPRGLAYEVLVAKTASEQLIREAIEAAMPPAGEKSLRGHIAFRPESKQALEQARRASIDLGHDWVGTEHTLLALIRTEESPAAQILRDLGFTSDGLHETVSTEIAKRLTTRDK